MMYRHSCPDNNFEIIDDEMDEFDACTCKIDSNGYTSTYQAGDKVWVIPLKQSAIVIEQVLHHDGFESFWGNLKLQYADGGTGVSHGWQCVKLHSPTD